MARAFLQSDSERELQAEEQSTPSSNVHKVVNWAFEVVMETLFAYEIKRASEGGQSDSRNLIRTPSSRYLHEERLLNNNDFSIFFFFFCTSKR